ncbi:3-hydroxyacyl-ACP dehydratase FabZ [soil metagenome]|nr:3-hydroxyacyl-ACP dehydratase FabZ [Trueperaceae bacterium]
MAVDVRDMLPHRFPFLMVDAFVSQRGDEFECVKNVSHGEPYFQGHFPSESVMPGVLMIEALAQAAAIGLQMREGDTMPEGAVGYLAGIDGARFRRKVVPGDRLRLTGTITRFRRGLCTVEAIALVGDEVAATATLSFVYAR